MRIIDYLIMILSAASAAAYICRLDAMQFKNHKLRVIILHLALATCAFSAGFSAWEGHVTLQGIAGLGASILWIWISLPSWGRGQIPSYATKAMPLHKEHWPRVVGRGKE